MTPGRFALTLLMFAVSPFELSFGVASGYGKLFPVLPLSPAAFADPIDRRPKFVASSKKSRYAFCHCYRWARECAGA
jgi:hypothetical protein